MDPERERFQLQAYQPAQVTPLAGASLTVAGQVLSLIGNSMELVLDQTLPAGTAVRVQARNWVMLGEVLYCVPDGTRHKARLHLVHALPSPRELTDMNRRFFGQTARAPLTEMGGYSGWT
jgi:hypothetical protein